MKSIKTWSGIVLFALVLGGNAGLTAGTIEFTADEGYVDGSLSSQEPYSGYKWKVTLSTYTVDTDNGGTLTGSAETNTHCFATRYQMPFEVIAGNTLMVSCDFRFKGFDVSSKAASNSERQRITVIDWGYDPNNVWSPVFSGVISSFEWQPAGTYGYQLSPGGKSGSYSAAALGLTEEGGTMSDLLRVSISTTVAESGNSTYTLKLDNLDGGTNIITASGTVDLSGYTNLYFSISGSSSKLSPSLWVGERVYFEEPPAVGTVIFIR